MGAKDIYRKYLSDLQTIYTINEATLITDWIFESIGGVLRFEMIKNPAFQFNTEIVQKLETALQKLLIHTPVQQIVGEAWFYRMKFFVNEHVLIPRPETEELVDLITKDSGNFSSDTSLKILDIGTGSGCISVALKKNIFTSFVTAMDISKEALEVAKKNATLHQVDINFINLDFLNEDASNSLDVFDVIVSNPPYIPEAELEKLDINVTSFEPHTALFVPDKTPLIFYEKISSFGKVHLKQGGKIYVETHENYANDVAALFATTYLEVSVHKDIFGKERMVTASRIR